MVREILRFVSTNGLPGKHHFYIAFQSDRPDVQIPKYLKEKYPDYVGIILQHQFEDLVVTEEAFEVTLSFHSTQSRIRVPFSAILSFEDHLTKDDPSLKLEFHLTPEIPEEVLTEGGFSEEPVPKKVPKGKKASANVVALDKFRKK